MMYDDVFRVYITAKHPAMSHTGDNGSCFLGGGLCWGQSAMLRPELAQQSSYLSFLSATLRMWDNCVTSKSMEAVCEKLKHTQELAG